MAAVRHLGFGIFRKLHDDRFNILRHFAIFIFGPFGLKLPIHAHLGEFGGNMTGFPLELGTGARGQLDCWGYQMVEKVLRSVWPFRHNTGM